MKTLTAKHYLLRIGIDRGKVPSFEHYAVTRQFLANPEAMLGQLQEAER